MWYTKGELAENGSKFIIKESISRNTVLLSEEELKKRVSDDGSVVGVRVINGALVFDDLSPELTKLLYLEFGDTISMLIPDIESWITVLFIGYFNNRFNFRFSMSTFSVSVNELRVGGYSFDFSHINTSSEIRESFIQKGCMYGGV